MSQKVMTGKSVEGSSSRMLDWSYTRQQEKNVPHFKASKVRLNSLAKMLLGTANQNRFE